MWPVSPKFLAELANGSQRAVFRADVLSGGSVLEGVSLRVLGGSAQVDASADIRRRCSCTVVDATGVLIPKNAKDVLSPYGYELRLWRGYNYLDGTSDELVPLGTFRIASAKVADSGAPIISIDGFDRSRSVRRARFEAPYIVPSGTNFITAIRDLIASRLPGALFSATSTAATTPLLVFDQASDPWDAAQQMARSIGCEVFFDPMGVCVIRTEPNPSGAALTYTYTEGVNSIITSVENALDDEPGYNGVVVDGEPATGTPVHSVVYDNDPASPTYSQGRYGKVPTFAKSQYITTQAQADEAAAAALRRNRGGTEQLSFSAIPNPAHEGGDFVRVVRPAIGVDSEYLVQSFTVPFDVSGAMGITTQKRRST